MYQVLEQRARLHISAEPAVDRQVVLKPAKISRQNGARGSVRVILENIHLPTLIDEYHVYQIGQLNPVIFGIELAVPNTWTTLESIANSENMQIDVYSNDGVVYPKSLVYAMVTENDNMIIAVLNTPKVFDLRTNPVYIRFYSNAFEASEMAVDIDVMVYSESRVIKSNSDIAAILNVYLTYSAKVGLTRVYWNGYLSDLPGMGQVSVGDTLEVVYDASIYKVLEFPVSDLTVYDSTLDGVSKYLIHPNKDELTYFNPETGTDELAMFYRDDIDAYLVSRTSGAMRGVYMHHNVEQSMRMVTHADYGIPAELVAQYTAYLAVPGADTVIRMYFRHDGHNEFLTSNANFTKELYKLNDDDIVKAMTSAVTSIGVWHADTLESTRYSELMRSRSADITSAMALDAFGYHAAAELIMDAPVRVYGQGENVVAPVGYSGAVLNTLHDFEYLRKPLITRYTNGSIQTQVSGIRTGSSDYRISTLANRGNVYLNERYVAIPEHLGFNCYKAIKQDGLRTGDWEDVTGTADYDYSDGGFTWAIDMALYSVAIVPGDWTDINTVTVLAGEAVSKQWPVPDQLMDGVETPTAENIYVYGNHVMIPGIDYIRTADGWVVTNKVLVNNTDPVLVTIMKLGMVSNTPRSEFGFIKYNTVSYNGRYDIVDGVSIRANISGRLLSKRDLNFVEGRKARPVIGIPYTEVKEGMPYELQYYRGPIDGIKWSDLLAKRTEEEIRIADISAYVEARIPEPVQPNPVFIERLYNLYSPFINAITLDLANQVLAIPPERITNEEMGVLLADYLYLLPYDPVLSPRYNSDFIAVHPTAVDAVTYVATNEYVFIQQAIDHWLSGEISLTNFIGIK